MLFFNHSDQFFSNGLDTDYISSISDSAPAVMSYLASFQSLVARILTFPLCTASALNGHTFAGGAIFALAHDYRIMEADSKGRMCVPLGEYIG